MTKATPGNPMGLSRNERDIYDALKAAGRRVLTRDLCAAVGLTGLASRNPMILMRVRISQMNRKLARHGEMIEGVRMAGYRLIKIDEALSASERHLKELDARRGFSGTAEKHAEYSFVMQKVRNAAEARRICGIGRQA